jgi:hypothetical protein
MAEADGEEVGVDVGIEVDVGVGSRLTPKGPLLAQSRRSANPAENLWVLSAIFPNSWRRESETGSIFDRAVRLAVAML